MSTTGQTGIRSVAARVIADHQGAVLLTRNAEGYQFTGRKKETVIVCRTWPETERVLIRMKVSSVKIAKIRDHLDLGNQIVLRPEFLLDNLSETRQDHPDLAPTKL